MAGLWRVMETFWRVVDQLMMMVERMDRFYPD
jgi:hypothetical protein